MGRGGSKIYMINFDNYNNFLELPLKYYPTDSAVYFSFQRVNRIDLLLQVCEWRCVLTPKVEKEIFGGSDLFWPYAGGYSTSSNIYLVDKWIREPKEINNYFYTLSSSWNDNFLFDSKNYQGYFYIANTGNYSTSSLGNLNFWQFDISKLKKEADKEILKWAIDNSREAILLANERLMVKLARKFGAFTMGSIGVLIKAVKNGYILFEEAERIYNKWSVLDPGSCIWLKDSKSKKLKKFDQIFYNLSNFNVG